MEKVYSIGPDIQFGKQHFLKRCYLAYAFTFFISKSTLFLFYFVFLQNRQELTSNIRRVQDCERQIGFSSNSSMQL